MHSIIYVAAFLFYEPEKVPARFHDLNADHQRMLDCLVASGLKWVAVLPPHLTGQREVLCYANMWNSSHSKNLCNLKVMNSKYHKIKPFD